MRELEASLQQFGEFVLKAQLVREKAARSWSATVDVRNRLGMWTSAVGPALLGAGARCSL